MKACALLLLILVSVDAIAADTSLRVMTYNIRLDVAADGDNAWPHRRAWVASQILWLRPQIFGLQEVQPQQREDLIADLPDYRLLGEGRDGGAEGEASPIGFDTRALRFVEGGTFWLSSTPGKPSRAWDAAFPRIVTWARLRVRGTLQAVLVLNTHWDHIGLLARYQSAVQMLGWIQSHAKRCEPVVVLGDFNSELDSSQMKALMQAPLSLRDARAASGTAPFGPMGTFNGFQIAPAASPAIDHILVSRRVAVKRFAVFAQGIEGRVPSDHYPVLADVAFGPCK